MLSATPKVSFLVPARASATELPESLPKLWDYLNSKFGSDFEILIIANPARENTEFEQNADGQSLRVALDFEKRFSNIRIVRHYEPRGKFAALRTGVEDARGEWIFMTDSDLPFAMNFFDEATELLGNGFELVFGNRRRHGSASVVPSELLTRFLLRDFLGRTLNLAARILMPSIKVRDTQAGIKAMSARFAKDAFESVECDGFYGDLEVLLFAVTNKYRYTDLPVRLEVNDSKSSVRIAREVWKTGYWLLRIWFNNLNGRYRLRRGHRGWERKRSAISDDSFSKDRITGKN